MKKLLFILLTLFTLQSFAQDTIYVKVRNGIPGVYNMSKNTGGDSIVFYVSGVRYALSAGAVSSVAGKIGAVTLNKSDVGLSNVDNTSDISKPVSTAVQNALNLKANDNAVVHLANTEKITGTKTFSLLSMSDTTNFNGFTITSIAPSITLNLIRNGGGGYFAPTTTVNAGLYTNSTFKTLEYGAFGNLNATPNITYSYFGVGSDANYYTNNLRLYPDKTVGLMTVNDAQGNFLTWNGGTVTRRTAPEVLSDIGAASSADLGKKLDTSYRQNLYAKTPIKFLNDSTIGITDTAVLTAAIIGGVQPASNNPYNLYVYGGTGYAGSTEWNGGVYASRNKTRIFGNAIQIFTQKSWSPSSEVSDIGSIQFTRRDPSGNIKKGTIFGNFYFGANWKNSQDSLLSTAYINAEASEDWVDTLHSGTDLSFYGKRSVSDTSNYKDPNLLMKLLGDGQVKLPYYTYAPSSSGTTTLFVDKDSLLKVGKLSDVMINLPSRIYATEGIQSNIYFQNFIFSNIAKENLGLVMTGVKGAQFSKFFRVTPIASDAGSFQTTITAYDYYHNMLAVDTSTLYISDKLSGHDSVRNILCIGTSLTAANPLNIIPKDDTMHLNFVGTQGTAPNLNEGRSGWRITDFITSGRTFYKISVGSVITPPSIGSVYSYTGGSGTVRETNITSGTGYISIEVTSGSAPPASGTLTLVSGSGDATLNYSSYTITPGNPFWNNGKINIANYLSSNSITLKNRDWVIIEIGANDLGSVTTTIDSVVTSLIAGTQTLIDSFKAAIPGIRVAVCLQPLGTNQDGFGSNYGTAISSYQYNYNVRRYQKAQLDAWDKASGDNEYIFPLALVIDPDFGMSHSVGNANSRTTEQSTIYTNGVHPNSSGNDQWGDALFAFLKYYE
jgi:lysophospholipase L1-like esterase